MYYHQVLNDMENYVDEANKHKDEVSSVLHCLLLALRRAQRYHLGNITDIKNISKKKTDLFIGDMGKDVRLPYESVWFDFSRNGSPFRIFVRNGGYELNINKQGALCHYDVEDQYTVMRITPFHYYKENKYWIPSLYSYMVLMNNDMDALLKLKETATINKQENSRLYDMLLQAVSMSKLLPVQIDEHPHIVPMPIDMDYFSKLNEEEKRGVVDIDDEVLSTINTGMVMLSCKNIITDTINPPPKMVKIRKRRGKKPLYTYKVLKIKTGKTTKGNKGIRTDITHRAHMCSGHWKTYTKDNPLFGRIVGKYWWNSHIRGNTEEGTVEKEYTL